MSQRTSLRRQFHSAESKLERRVMLQSKQAHQTCNHSKTQWIAQGSRIYCVCVACGEIIKEESK